MSLETTVGESVTSRGKYEYLHKVKEGIVRIAGENCQCCSILLKCCLIFCVAVWVLLACLNRFTLLSAGDKLHVILFRVPTDLESQRNNLVGESRGILLMVVEK